MESSFSFQDNYMLFLPDFQYIPEKSPAAAYNNVSSMNYYTQYQRLHRTYVTISSKSLSIYMSPLLNSPLRMGELTYGFVSRILYKR